MTIDADLKSRAYEVRIMAEYERQTEPDRHRREATAATVLAALIQASGGDYENDVITRTAVTLADALRAELAKP